MNHEFQIGFLKHNIHLHASVPNKFEFMIRSREGRINFSIRNFAVKYNLGQPVAGNLFQAQYGDYVPKLHEQLSG